MYVFYNEREQFEQYFLKKLFKGGGTALGANTDNTEYEGIFQEMYK